MTDLGPQTYQSMWKGDVPNRPPISMKTIREEVADKYGIDPALLMEPGRRRHIAWPRQEFMWRCRQVKWSDGSQRYSLPQIAAFLGMDHTSILHGVRAHHTRIHRFSENCVETDDGQCAAL